MKLRTLKMKWTQRNVSRMHNLLKLKFNFLGDFESVDSKYEGYKSCNGEEIFFHFTTY